MADASALMDDPLTGFVLEGHGVRLCAAPFTWRWSLRADPAAMDGLAGAWGACLPERMLASKSASDRHALRLGPDEWLLLSSSKEPGAALMSLSADPPFSLVDVSHRNVAIEVAGPAGAIALNAGVPLDLSERAFAAGSCTRTLLGKAEIILWRPTRDPVWRVEVWRSFADYVKRYLVQALTDL